MLTFVLHYHKQKLKVEQHQGWKIKAGNSFTSHKGFHQGLDTGQIDQLWWWLCMPGITILRQDGNCPQWKYFMWTSIPVWRFDPYKRRKDRQTLSVPTSNYIAGRFTRYDKQALLLPSGRFPLPFNLSNPFYIPGPWKRYPFWAGHPPIGHSRG